MSLLEPSDRPNILALREAGLLPCQIAKKYEATTLELYDFMEWRRPRKVERTGRSNSKYALSDDEHEYLLHLVRDGVTSTGTAMDMMGKRFSKKFPYMGIYHRLQRMIRIEQQVTE